MKKLKALFITLISLAMMMPTFVYAKDASYIEGDSSLLKYFVVEKPYLESGDTQTFILSYDADITDVSLIYASGTGTTTKIQGEDRGEGIYTFEKEFQETDQGEYIVQKIEYVLNGQNCELDFEQLEMDARFGVDQQYTGYGENIGYAIDENGTEIELTDSEDAISVASLDSTNADAVESVVADTMLDTMSLNSETMEANAGGIVSDKIIIAIDPGHGGTDVGSITCVGTYEKDINFKIATYLKAELEEYENVEVVMTRDDDSYVELEERTEIAQEYGANYFVSVHINAATSTSAKGVEVYYPNTNWKEDLSEEGKEIAEEVLEQLVALGLKSRGVKCRNHPTSLYPDGSEADWDSVIRNSKIRGMAAILIEHAFGTNTSDYNNYLKTDEQLKKLGVADAKGIAEALGLQKINSVPMYRVYNPNSGEHFYTSSKVELSNLVSLGWENEGIGWYAPKSGSAVYRLYNANGGEHHYTLSETERDALVEAGWSDEGIGWYSEDENGVPVYRQYNPNAFANNHNYTVNTNEKDYLIELGWNDEGIGWYGKVTE